MSYQEREFGSSYLYLFPVCILLIYLVLAAYFESLSTPIAVISLVPMAIFSILIGSILFHLNIDIFTQIAFFVIAGLACKNALLIVDFTAQRESEGLSHIAALIRAIKQRFRPIIVTSVAFILGALPLIFSSGAGSEIRFSMGVSVVSGMIGVTIFSLVYTPITYFFVKKFMDEKT